MSRREREREREGEKIVFEESLTQSEMVSEGHFGPHVCVPGKWKELFKFLVEKFCTSS